MAEGLIGQVRERYEELQRLSPNHELLKYFCLREDNFGFVDDTETKVEFTQRFHEGAPDIEQLKKQQKKIPFREYQRSLVSAVFGNYLNALEQSIKDTISSN